MHQKYSSLSPFCTKPILSANQPLQLDSIPITSLNSIEPLETLFELVITFNQQNLGSTLHFRYHNMQDWSKQLMVDKSVT